MFDKKRKEYKIPNQSLPCPSLKDFGKETCYYREDNAIFLKGVGNKKGNANIIFLTSTVLEEDADNSDSDPVMNKSPSMQMFRRICLNEGINLDNEYTTALCKYPIPRSYKLKPKPTDIKYCSALLEEEIEQVKPSIIVCLGKEPASYILGLNAALSEIEESWIFSKKYNTMVYIIEDAQKSFYKPEYQDKMIKDIRTLSKYYFSLCNGKSYFNSIPQNYRLIDKINDLKSWIGEMLIGAYKVFAVDCEWGGMNYYDGTLRSIQFCWSPGNAVFIHFHDENLEWQFDAPPEKVHELLRSFFNQHDIKFVGHNIAADYQWMYSKIGIDIFDNKCILDTMFGMQTVDEYSDLKLEKLAAKYTDLGRYDIDLLLWKKKNKGILFNEEEGYGKIPTSILFPYGCKDVDTTFRLYPIVKQMLIEDNTYDYYVNIKNPFVTEGFAEMSYIGIPFDMEYANKVRISYIACKLIMQKLFRKLIKDEAKSILFSTLQENLLEDKKQDIVKHFTDLITIIKDCKTGVKLLKAICGKQFINVYPAYEHFMNIDSFNPASADQKANWLFNVKKYVPVKTTKTTAGSAMDWERVLLLPEKEQKQYKPSVDKDTLKIYADRGDEICYHLLQMNAVDTITKTFLKGDEGGIQKFVASDNKVHTNYVLTESSRPRSFKPNILNIPRYITDEIKAAFVKANKELNIIENKETHEYDTSNYNIELFDSIVADIRDEYDIEENISITDFIPTSIRSCFGGVKDWYFADADLKTAEIFAIAYLSNDTGLINALTTPDHQFAFKKLPDGSKKTVRICYDDSIVELTEDAKDPTLLTDPNDPDLLRDEQGNLLHPNQDLHWNAVETKYFLNTPREKLDKNKTRDSAGKVSNFSIPYGTSPAQLERKIWVVTGTPPEKGTGEKLIKAYMKTKPGVEKFLASCREKVKNPGYFQSLSGYKRHFIVPDENSGMPQYLVKKSVSSAERESCNIPLQNLVADTLAIAVVNINRELRKLKMQSRVIIPLYDACYVYGPYYEIDKSHEIIKKCFSTDIIWKTPGGDLRFKTDHETTKRWGTKMTEDEEKELDNLKATIAKA